MSAGKRKSSILFSNPFRPRVFCFLPFFLSLSQSTKKHSSNLISLSLSYLFSKFPSLLVSSFPRKQEKESGVFGLWGISMVTFFGGGGLSFVSLSLSLSLSPPMGSTHSTSPAQASPCLRLPLGTLTTLRASPASWTCVEKMGWREREREKRSERCERERAKREQEKQLFSYRNCQLTLGALGTLTTLRASPASWTCVERWGGGRDRERERERERERKEVRGARERAKREQEKQTLLLSKLPTHLGSLDDLEGLAGLVGFASLDVDLC